MASARARRAADNVDRTPFGGNRTIRHSFRSSCERTVIGCAGRLDVRGSDIAGHRRGNGRVHLRMSRHRSPAFRGSSPPSLPARALGMHRTARHRCEPTLAVRDLRRGARRHPDRGPGRPSELASASATTRLRVTGSVASAHASSHSAASCSLGSATVSMYCSMSSNGVPSWIIRSTVSCALIVIDAHPVAQAGSTPRAAAWLSVSESPATDVGGAIRRSRRRELATSCRC
jgi:hypothetical protein